jgi:hypothetical protein
MATRNLQGTIVLKAANCSSSVYPEVVVGLKNQNICCESKCLLLSVIGTWKASPAGALAFSRLGKLEASQEPTSPLAFKHLQMLYAFGGYEYF